MFLILHREFVYIYFARRAIQSRRKKIIGDHTRLLENDDLPLKRAPAVKKKPPFFYARAIHA